MKQGWSWYYFNDPAQVIPWKWLTWSKIYKDTLTYKMGLTSIGFGWTNIWGDLTMRDFWSRLSGPSYYWRDWRYLCWLSFNFLSLLIMLAMAVPRKSWLISLLPLFSCSFIIRTNGCLCDNYYIWAFCLWLLMNLAPFFKIFWKVDSWYFVLIVADQDVCPSLREICAATRSDEKQV